MAGAKMRGWEAFRSRLARQRALLRLRSRGLTRPSAAGPAIVPEPTAPLMIEVVLRNGRVVRFPERIGARRAARLADALDRERVMISLPAGTHIWVACGVTDMRKGFDSLAMVAQEVVKQSPRSGHVFVFRGRRADRLKILWWDGTGLCLYAKRMERGRFVWPVTQEGTVRLTRRTVVDVVRRN